MLTMDHSGSMQATDVAPSRLVAAREAGEAFLARVPAKVRVGGVVFDHRTEVVRTRRPTARACARRSRDAMVPSGGTATGDALAASLAMLDAQRGAGAKRPPGAIVLLSDGESTSGRDPLAVAEEARTRACRSTPSRSGRPAGTTARRPGRPARHRIAAPIAERSGGQAFTAQDASGLSAVYERLGSQVAMKQEQREITGAFAGGAIAAAARRRPLAALVPAADLSGA